MQHKTLPLRPDRSACSEAVCVQDIRELVRAVNTNSPSICAEGLRRLHDAVEQGFSAGGEDRGVLTLRRIAHHYDGSGCTTRCPSLPPICARGVDSIRNVGPLTHAAADIESAGEDSVDFGGETCVDSEAEDSADITNLTATGVPTNADEHGVDAVVDRVSDFVATWQQSNASSGSGMQRADVIHRNVMIIADDFIQYLGRLEADLEHIHFTTPLDQRDRVRGALGTLMSTAAEFYCKKQIADITSESVGRLDALRTFHGSNGAFLELNPPRSKD